MLTIAYKLGYLFLFSLGSDFLSLISTGSDYSIHVWDFFWIVTIVYSLGNMFFFVVDSLLVGIPCFVVHCFVSFLVVKSS